VNIEPVVALALEGINQEAKPAAEPETIKEDTEPDNKHEDDDAKAE
jgi:hypothetical protein